MPHLTTAPDRLTGTFTCTVEATVEVTITDEDAVLRVTGPEGDAFRKMLYDLRTRDDVIAHLARSAVYVGYSDASNMDGWADLSRGVVTMRIDHVAEPYFIEHGTDSWNAELTR